MNESSNKLKLNPDRLTAAPSLDPRAGSAGTAIMPPLTIINKNHILAKLITGLAITQLKTLIVKIVTYIHDLTYERGFHCLPYRITHNT